MDTNQIIYQIYPLGFCGAPAENDGITVPRIRKVLDWIPHLKQIGVTAVYFGPVFESDRHGYDTRDYRKIDCRLGTNEDFRDVCAALHKENIKVILDGVFNHVGRGCFAFQDVLQRKWDSPYTNWFHIDYGNNNNPDGFWYGDWEGHRELVKLNVENPDVKNYLFSSIDSWVEDYGIDGLRLDVAYCLSKNFLWDLHHHVKSRYGDFFLLGEMIGGDYNTLLQDGLLDSVTNYECRKGLFSSMNTANLFEIGYSLNRQFGSDPWCLYRGRHLLTFADNHDVDRLASVLNDARDLPLTYAIMYAMPGIPCIYYGSEWGAEGARTKHSDHALRPCFDAPQHNELTDYISALSRMRTSCDVFDKGDYKQLYIQNKQLVFRRRSERGQIIFAINIDDQPAVLRFNAEAESAKDLLSGETVTFTGELHMPGKSARFLYTQY